MDDPEPLKEDDEMAEEKADPGLPEVKFGSGEPEEGDSGGKAETTPPPFKVEAPKAPPQQQQQQYQQPYQQQYQQPPMYGQAPLEPTSTTLGRMFAGSIWFLALLGGILLLIGQIMVDVGVYSDDPENLIKGGRVLSDIGIFMFGVPMIVAGAYHHQGQPHVRFGLILGGAVMLMAMTFV